MCVCHWWKRIGNEGAIQNETYARWQTMPDWFLGSISFSFGVEPTGGANRIVVALIPACVLCLQLACCRRRLQPKKSCEPAGQKEFDSGVACQLLPAGLKRYKKIINSCIPLYVMSWD